MNEPIRNAPRPLVIGVGNSFNGDDAAGRLVAQALVAQDPDFDVIESFGGAADLVTGMESRTNVLIVDACRSGMPAGSIHRFDAGAAPLPSFLNAVSSHAIGIGEGIELARVLNILPVNCQVIAIEGVEFSTGAPLTAAVECAVRQCVHEILSRFAVPQ